MKRLATGIAAVLFLTLVGGTSPAQGADDHEKRGCCSHHDGVCGCASGRTICCDQSTSPSCTC